MQRLDSAILPTNGDTRKPRGQYLKLLISFQQTQNKPISG